MFRIQQIVKIKQQSEETSNQPALSLNCFGIMTRFLWITAIVKKINAGHCLYLRSFEQAPQTGTLYSGGFRLFISRLHFFTLKLVIHCFTYLPQGGSCCVARMCLIPTSICLYFYLFYLFQLLFWGAWVGGSLGRVLPCLCSALGDAANRQLHCSLHADTFGPFGKGIMCCQLVGCKI